MNVRPFGEADFEAVAALLAFDEEAVNGIPSHVGAGELQEWTSTTNLAEDSWLYEDEHGPAALAWTNEREGLGFAAGAVHPRAKGRGLGAQLVERTESRARELGARRLHQVALGRDDAAARLFESRGYRDVRRFYEMVIELEAPPDPPAVAVEPLALEDARAFHAALDEAFEDHWEHRATPFEEWWQRRSSLPSFDLSLWFVIRDGDEIAGVARSEERASGGYVGHIGVRRAWRGKGYAKALLVHSFRELYARGHRRITLGVDAESPTGATHLYERVGMHVEHETVVFEKALG